MSHHDHHEKQKDNKKTMPVGPLSTVNPTSYWQDVEDKEYQQVKRENEFADGVFDVGAGEKGRRDFLKLMGFGLFVLPVASSCKKISPEKAIPYLYKNDQVVPGVANWYASTVAHSGSVTPILVKSREGRPIKIEGNTMAPYYEGAISAACQASVLSLYDSHRYRSAMKSGQAMSYDVIDEEIIKSLEQSQAQGKKIALVIRQVSGPSQMEVLKTFRAKYPNVELIIYNPFGRSAEARGCQESFGRRDKLEYDFAQADMVVSINHDFLNAGVEPVHLTRQYSKRRDLSQNKSMLRHVHIESHMSLTGANADNRVVVGANEISVVVHNLLVEIQKLAGRTLFNVKPVGFDQAAGITKLAKELWGKRGAAPVTYSGTNVADYVKVNAINSLLGNHGKSVYLAGRSYVAYEDDAAFVRFVERAGKGEFSHALFYHTNPVYDYPEHDKLMSALNKVPHKISFSFAPDETSETCQYVVPGLHYLEKWNDYELSAGLYSFAQPVIDKLFDNRDADETLLNWSGKSEKFDKVMKRTWENLAKSIPSAGRFAEFWAKCIHDGILQTSKSPGLRSFRMNSSVHTRYLTAPKLVQLGDNQFQLVAYQKTGIHKGEYANNPWLQELPDPVTKATWDNYVMISPKTAKSMKIKSGDVLQIKVDGKSLSLPALVQAGTHPQTLAIAYGYGRTVAGKAGKGVGGNIREFTTYNGQDFAVVSAVMTVDKTGKTHELAQTQTHHSVEGRDVIRETVFADYQKDPTSGNNKDVHLYSMWSKHRKDGHQWAMAIDLSKCTGCSACIVSCNAENNVPVVGKDEVKRRREMHWIRIDRYYSGDENNPQVVHQPMTCLHCENAPCETVCPTLATVHSSDGLNQQVYNRCVGTRYCANNCPYKVRRFNWFNYKREDKLENMVLNPDVTVRSRGVMEKCTMCIQRIQEKRFVAKNAKRALADGEIQTACQQSCPGDAIVFGDLNDPNSKINQKVKDPRYYRAIEELGTSPRVGFMTKVRHSIES